MLTLLAYDQLASDMKDKINIIAVNCDDHRPLCVKHEVKAFPTIKLSVNDPSGTVFDN